MGKGDKKTAKGKRIMGSYGNTRPRPSNKPDTAEKKK
ncbi:MAG: 30S ribosomal protein THX [Flavobacteriales bacterium]|nr:30S ribosomal protein THX [Flavobacteriales bacterium]